MTKCHCKIMEKVAIKCEKHCYNFFFFSFFEIEKVTLVHSKCYYKML